MYDGGGTEGEMETPCKARLERGDHVKGQAGLRVDRSEVIGGTLTPRVPQVL